MIYLKNTNEKQEVYIAKNGDYAGKKTYKEGYDDGYIDGMEEGKNNPYSTKGFFFENGEKEYIYPVRIDRDTMLTISFLNSLSPSYAEISFYPLGNGCVLANQSDSDIVCAMRGDFLRVFIYNTLQFELPCGQGKWHTLRLYADRVILDGEETYFNTPYLGGSLICACVNRGGNGFYRGLIQYMKGVEDEAVMYYISDLEKGGFKRLRSDNGISDWYENSFVSNWGEFPIMLAKAPLNSVFINVEGGNVCPELTVLDVDSNGRYEGAFSAVNVNVPDVNGSYDEGYNNGYNDGLNAGGGSCNLGQLDVNWDSGWTKNYFYADRDGYDGYSVVSINAENALNEKYNEGYNDGKAEGGDCPELTELNVTENGTYEGAYNKVNVDVPQEGGSCNLEETRWGNPLPFDVNESYLIIQPSMGYDGMKKVALQMDDYNAEKYNEGYEAGKAEGGSCNIGSLDSDTNTIPHTDSFIYAYANEYGVDGWSYISIDYKPLRREIAEQTKNKIDNELQTLTITENGHYEPTKVKCMDFSSDDVFQLGNYNSKYIYDITFTPKASNYDSKIFGGWVDGKYMGLTIEDGDIIARWGKYKAQAPYTEGEITHIVIKPFSDDSAFIINDDLHSWWVDDESITDDFNTDMYLGETDNRTANFDFYKMTIYEDYEGWVNDLNAVAVITPWNNNQIDVEGDIRQNIGDGAYCEMKEEKLSLGFSEVVVNIPEEGNITSSTVEKEYNTIALRTKNIHDSDIILDRPGLVGYFGGYTENGYISYTQNKNGIVITKKPQFSNPLVSGIESGGLNWNTIEYFYSYTITTFGENMTRGVGSNVRQIHLDSPIMNTEGADIVFRSGCFATSNLLNKIVFYKPLKVMVYDNAFEGVSSSGEVVVVGEGNAKNRAKYDTLMAQLGDGWTLTFVNEYDE